MEQNGIEFPQEQKFNRISMANYKESNVSGVEYQRCHQLKIFNPLIGAKAAEFYEEKILTINNTFVVTGSDSCRKVFNPAEVINLLDPATGNPTGETVTHQKLYEILYSLYLQTALERDNPTPP